MDYLRNLGSAAVSTLVQKSGLNLPFSLGQKVATVEGMYNLYDAIKRDDSSPVSVFEYDFSDASKKNLKGLAQNALRKLRTTRHPDVLKFMDAVESDVTIHIMTERVKPLQEALSAWSSRTTQEKEEWLLWGFHRISVALTFINDSCTSTHGKLSINSVFISPAGEWKLGGFELLSNPRDDVAVLYTLGGEVPGSSLWASPEVKKNGWSILKQHDPATADAYALGVLLHSAFNPAHPPPETTHPPHTPPSPSSRGAIPNSIFNAFKRLLNPIPKNRLTAKGFLEIGMTDTGFFSTNRLVRACLGLDNFALSNESEKNVLLRTLKDTISLFPVEFSSYRVLPSLLSALEFGGASAASILPLVLQLGKNVSPEDYPNSILAPIIKLYASPDRGTRMALLEHLPEYVDKLDKKAISDKIFPNLQTGFADTVAVIREATVKSIILLSPKFNDRILNNDLLRLLAKMQMDPEPSIRTNTCILIGRLGPSLGYNTKRKVLVPAFSRALKDSFVHARVAGLMAFMATIDCFDVDDIATKVIPNMAFTMIDKEKLVRDQAFKAVDLFVKRLENHASSMPETVMGDTLNVMAPNGSGPIPETLVNSAAGAAGALASWAISSLGKKLATTDLASTMEPVSLAALDTAASGPTLPGTLPIPESSTTSTPQPPNKQASQLPHSKGLQLGANKGSLRQTNSSLAEVLADEVNSTEANPWGNADLIDINADDDDWSAFESAPTIVEPKPEVTTKLSYQKWNDVPKNSLNSNRLHSSLATQPRKLQQGMRGAQSPASSRSSTPVLSPAATDDVSWDDTSNWETTTTASPGKTTSNVVNVAGMTSEEKAAEMMRRKEERKQRIALLKEQKKNAAK